MAHVQKFTSGSVGGLSIHIDRKTLNHSNKDIDTDKTHLNYDLCEKEGDLQSRYQERLSEVYCMKRADVKSCAGWVLTLPEELKESSSEQQKEFFESSYVFFKNRYGEKNVLSATVHNDETTPHLHFAFMPVVFDEKKNREKVSAKIVLNRNELKNFHQDLDNHLKENLHFYEKGVLNGNTIGIDDIKILKEKSKDIEKLKSNLDSKKKEILKEYKEINVSPKKHLINISKIKNRSYEKGIINKRIEMSPEDFSKLIKMGQENIKIRYINSRYSKQNTDLKNEFDELRRQYQEKINEKTDEIDLLKEKNEKLDVELGILNQNLEDEIITRVVYADVLMNDFNFTKISQTEINARVVLNKLDKGHEPKTLEESQEWKDRLEKASNTRINPSRLENGINKVKEFIEKFKEKIKAVKLKKAKRKEQEWER